MQNKVATIGLVAFLAVDVALVALALRPGVRRRPARPALRPPRSRCPARRRRRRPRPPPRPARTSTAATGTAPSAARKPAPVTQLVGALDATTAWRASTGDVSSKVARRSRSRPTAARPGTRPGAARSAPSPACSRSTRTASSCVAAGGGLRAQAVRQQRPRATPGRRRQAISGGWARQLDEPTEVLTPQDDRAQPCGTSTDVIDLSRTSAEPGSGAVRRRRGHGDQRRRRRPGPTPAHVQGRPRPRQPSRGRPARDLRRAGRRQLPGHPARPGRQGQQPRERRVRRHERAVEGGPVGLSVVERRRLDGRGRHRSGPPRPTSRRGSSPSRHW